MVFILSKILIAFLVSNQRKDLLVNKIFGNKSIYSCLNRYCKITNQNYVLYRTQSIYDRVGCEIDKYGISIRILYRKIFTEKD